jgi:hypothetical protein
MWERRHEEYLIDAATLRPFTVRMFRIHVVPVSQHPLPASKSGAPTRLSLSGIHYRSQNPRLFCGFVIGLYLLPTRTLSISSCTFRLCDIETRRSNATVWVSNFHPLEPVWA